MKSHKLSTIVYAQGWLDTFFENYENDATPIRDEDIDEYKEHALEMWRILNDGLDELRKENTSLENKLALIDMARNTET
jgi:hypothetical protein